MSVFQASSLFVMGAFWPSSGRGWFYFVLVVLFWLLFVGLRESIVECCKKEIQSGGPGAEFAKKALKPVGWLLWAALPLLAVGLMASREIPTEEEQTAAWRAPEAAAEGALSRTDEGAEPE